MADDHGTRAEVLQQIKKLQQELREAEKKGYNEKAKNICAKIEMYKKILAETP